ncbi:MAG TPA: succinate dehydrogenase iron-sulfur subunit [Chloroflexota bacterium]|nr:succinate dehydrogenase iron-sulfur subunit [Chloroflexota bacterium]
MFITFRIQRFDPEKDAKPYWQEFQVAVEPMDRVLDGLNAIKWYQDGTLTYRRSCGHGVCGSDAMRINGRNRLACKLLVRDVGSRVEIQPLPAFRVIKDLVVDLEPFFQQYKAVKPWLVNDEPAPEAERPQSPEERAQYDDTTKCILCACCTAACPPYWLNHEYIGPAAIVNGHRFLFDSRDRARAERLAILNDRYGVWRCRTVRNCTEACPRGIDVMGAIGAVKRELLLEN